MLRCFSKCHKLRYGRRQDKRKLVLKFQIWKLEPKRRLTAFLQLSPIPAPGPLLAEVSDTGHPDQPDLLIPPHYVSYTIAKADRSNIFNVAKLRGIKNDLQVHFEDKQKAIYIYIYKRSSVGREEHRHLSAMFIPDRTVTSSPFCCYNLHNKLSSDCFYVYDRHCCLGKLISLHCADCSMFKKTQIGSYILQA